MIEEREIVTILHDFQKRGASADKLGWVMEHLKNGSGDLSQETTEKIQAILLKTYKDERNLAHEVREWVLSTTGNFSSTEIVKFLHLSTLQEQKNLSIILKRMSTLNPDCKEPLIEKCGDKNGWWKRVSNTIRFTDFRTADPNDFIVIKFPLGIERKTRIFPKSIIMLAGVTGTGKTTYLLNLIRDNMADYEIRYINSELSAQMLNFKLQQFQTPVDAWTFRHIDGWENIQDTIHPDAINIIDYLSAGNNAYEIKQPIEQILKKLNRGIAIIAIQKKPGSTFGTGGIYSAMDASLFVSMEWGALQITKNRCREVDEFPRLDKRDFTIKHGLVISQSGWYVPDSGKDRDFVKEK